MEEKTKKKADLGEIIYNAPMLQVIAVFAAAAVAVCLIVGLIMLILGFGFVTETVDDGRTVKYFGIIRDGTPTFGWLCDSDGNRGFVSKNGIKYKDGSRYEGDLSGFYYNDSDAIYTDSDGNVYRGNFQWGKLEGHVVAEYASGGGFEGSYLNGKRHGYGKETFYDDKGNAYGYSGDYADGEKNGYGELVYRDGSIYKGNFKNGMRHGEGFYRYKTGDTYTGEFRNNVIYGAGTMMFTSGRVFSGEFINGIPVLE